MNDTDFVGGFAKGLTVIEAFGETTRRLSIADVSRLTGLDRATARRSLLTLAKLGYADYDGKYFTLTPRILRLGHAYLSATPLPGIIQPHIDRLSEAVEQSVSASVLEGAEITYVARAAFRKVMSINLVPGSRLPAWCTSMGRVLLADLPDATLSEVLSASDLVAHTPHTITDRAALMAEFGRIRSTGYALINQELEVGLCSLAVPIRNSRGKAIAAINIGLAAGVVPAEAIAARYLADLERTSADIERQLP